MLKKTRKWARSGAGEVLTFAVVTPFLLMVVIFVVGLLRYMGMNEKLITATAAAARAAAVAPTLKDAQARAEEVATMNFGAYMGDMKTPMKVKVQIKNDFSSNAENLKQMKDRAQKRSKDGWAKGKMASVRIDVEASTPFPVGFDSKRWAELPFAIEVEPDYLSNHINTK